MRICVLLLAGFTTLRIVQGATSEDRLVLPLVLYSADTIQTTVQFDAVKKDNTSYRVVVNCEKGTVCGSKWVFTPTRGDEGVYPIFVTLLDEEDSIIMESSSVLAVTQRLPYADELKLLIIGDSLTANGAYVRAFLDLLQSNGVNKVSTLGTAFSEGANFEAYPGNSFQRYLEGPDLFNSPFFYGDTGFDPQRYFEEELSGIIPDLVLIFLGINDMFSSSRGSDSEIETKLDVVLQRAEIFIQGLREAASGSPVALILPPPGSSSQNAFDAAYGEGIYSASDWQSTRLKLVDRYIERFSSREDEGVYLVPCCTSVDRQLDYNASDPIHPKNSGYISIANDLYCWLNYFLHQEGYAGWALTNWEVGDILMGLAACSGNLDGDLFSNRDEHIFRMNPFEYSPSPLIVSEGGLMFSHQKYADVRIEYSTNFNDWAVWTGDIDEDVSKDYITKRVSLLNMNLAPGVPVVWRLSTDP